jgi:two-component system nitrogen regulation response regulator NtrX
MDVKNNIPRPQKLLAASSGSFTLQEQGLRAAKENFEKNFINNILKKNEYNVTKTAQMLKIERSNLYKIMKRLGIDWY